MTIDLPALARDGFVMVPGLIPPDLLEAFHYDIDRFVASEMSRTPASAEGDEDPFVRVLTRNQPWREAIFPLLRNLMSVQRMGAYVADWLAASGTLEALGFEVPLVWPTLRADPPREAAYLLPFHQDYGSTRCTRAYRLWIPLRDANHHEGTMEVVHGSHALGPVPHDLSNPRYPEVPEEALVGMKREIITATAGDAVLFDTMLVHGSVEPRGRRTKFVLLVQAQDLATVMDPSDHDDDRGALIRRLAEARREAGG